MIDLKSIREADGELYESMLKEFERQQHNLELIASENIVSEAVLAAAGTFYTNKYAEGYPGKRYYGGCEYVDIAENLAIERAKNFSVSSLPTFNRIAAQTQTLPHITPFSRAATPCSA